MLTDSIQRHTRLQRLGGSSFELDPQQPDIRGWEVKSDMGRIGTVEDLVFDEQSGKVRYLAVDVQTNMVGLGHRQVLVPIGIAVIDKEDDVISLPGITSTQLLALPEYDADRFDTSSEESIRNVFGGLGAAALQGGEIDAASDNKTLTPGIDGAILDTSATGGMMTDETNGGQVHAALGGNPSDFYNHSIYNDQHFYSNRRTASVSANSNNQVELINEELTVENPPEYHEGIRLRKRDRPDQNY